MRKICFFLCVLFALATQAQEAKNVFIHMPDSLMPLLTSVNKADFIDFIESNMKAAVKNKLGGTSEMTALTKDYIHIRMTEKSVWEMKLLAVNDSTSIVCTVTTVSAPLDDSQIKFFSTTWQELPGTYLKLPGFDDFYQKADILLMKAQLSAEEPTLTLTYTTPEEMKSADGGDVEEVKSPTEKPLVYVWREGSFVPQ